MDFSNFLHMKASEQRSSIPPKKIGKRKKNSFKMKVKPSERGKLIDLKPSKDKRKGHSLQGPFTQVLSEDFVKALEERTQRATTARNNNGMSFIHTPPLHE